MKYKKETEKAIVEGKKAAPEKEVALKKIKQDFRRLRSSMVRRM